MKTPPGPLVVLLACGAALAAERTAPPRSRVKVPTQTEKPAEAQEPRCPTPFLGESVSASRILRDLREGKSVDLQGRIIEGNLDAELVWPPADDRKVSYLVVPGRLRLDSCRITGRFSFPRTVFSSDLMLHCTEILGEMDLSDSEVRGGLQMDNARILGEVRLQNLFVGAELSLRNTTCEDRLDLAGIRVRGLALTGGDFRRDVEISRAILNALDVSGSKIGSVLRLEDVLILSAFSGREATIGRSLTLASVRVAGLLDLTGSRLSGGFTLTDLHVGGNLVIPVASEGSASMAEVEVGRSLIMVDGTYDELSMSRVEVVASTEMDGAQFKGRVLIQDSRFGQRFNASEAVFGGDSEFRKVVFPGDDPMAGALFARAPTLIETTLPRPPTVMSEEGSEEGEAAADEETPNDDEGEDVTEDDSPEP